MELKIFAGPTNAILAMNIAQHLHTDGVLGDVDVKTFHDGEERIQFKDNIRGRDVFLIQSTNPPAKNLIRLLQMIDAAKRASAGRVTAVIPYFGYARQDRKDRPRVPVTAELIARLIQAAGADRVLTIDLHVNTIEGFFQIPVDHLYARPELRKALNGLQGRTFTVIGPDGGAIRRAEAYAERLGNHPIAYAHKRRSENGDPAIMKIIGEVIPDSIALIVDDIIDTGGTLLKVIQAVRKEYPNEIMVAAPHAILSDDAIELLGNSDVSRIFITDTTGRISEAHIAERILEHGNNKFTIVSVDRLVAEAIRRIHNDESVSSLFE